jgi:PPK2 family polyphosphate:nucleotide phosphotransferase
VRLEPVIKKRSIRLGDADARLKGSYPTGDALTHKTQQEADRIADLQRVLYADGRHALLIVLQGRDAAGKDGTIRKVFSAVNPQGCTVSTFGPPTDLEQRHDYLWRVHQQVPPKRMIGIFNRSHYEDILVPRVRGTLPKEVWARRYDQINDFERMLSAEGVTILKFFLHISREEQKIRLIERMTDPNKNWKIQKSDLDDRALWDDFTKAYRSVLARTSTKWAPWYVIPADDKTVRDWLVAGQIAHTLKQLHLRYPRADPDVLRLKVK